MVVLDKMRTIGVETLDINTMLHSVYNFNAENGHYLTVDPGKKQIVKGEFGSVVADRIINKIC